ncbi:polyprenyl synthetase family protein [Paenibacillus sp. J5C_2022]|uniref:polyprenyl synthetase family protein n=1 Tax=Paenibacillus sp. J5C2022 TaxID=2977129 RepID=UPI0021D2C834|nr:polyprenyl synthetase family protein [Paenibacillus sp. J5C2022]MCU6707451.1 polyprenyl synthetase family protein [Paenibacillus sp. J5C2022]
MEERYTECAATWYAKAEQKAATYFAALYNQVMRKAYQPSLKEDIQLWKKGRDRLPLLVRSYRKPDSKHYDRFIRWMIEQGKLDDYLDRSVSYIYMRDLGKSLASPDTAKRVKQVVDSVKKQLMISSGEEEHPSFFSLAGFYRWAQKEGVENAAIWVIGKLKAVSSHIPQEMNAEHAQRKLIKIIAGVVMHVMDEMDEGTDKEERSQRLDEAFRLGYSYGLTYPFIDDLIDSGILGPEGSAQYASIIRDALLTGEVPEQGEWPDPHGDLMQFVHSELSEALQYLKTYQQQPGARHSFFEQAYVFFQSQHVDRTRSMSERNLTNEELYVPIILKSSSSRLIVRHVISATEDEAFDMHTFCYGIYNQLADDFADLFEDLEAGAVTPFTYYWTYHAERRDLMNPFELYWAVIHYLIHHIYHSDAKTRSIILDRAFNGLKRRRTRLGEEKYKEVMQVFALEDGGLHELIDRVAGKVENVDFFDKLLRDQMVAVLRKNREDRIRFLETIDSIRGQINNQLLIEEIRGIPEAEQSLIDTANYSLEGSGKRLRPILAWVMAVNEYGLHASAIAPLLRSLEYMHTASLIFDDLPSQDNASTRRGRPTLHQVYNSATAELTGLFLIQKAMVEQSSLTLFDANDVLSLIHYSSQKAADMCMGQAMDLRARGRALTLEQLNRICFYKTGIAFEASLVMPAILARAGEAEIASLKKFAYHAGIAFQIKDDVLDAEGNASTLGKPIGADIQNESSTFVTALGLEGALKAMWEHYCIAEEELRQMPRKSTFLYHLLDYMVNRDS